MPRLGRLDAPGVVHRIRIRGIERRTIVTDDRNREDFLARLATAYVLKNFGKTVARTRKAMGPTWKPGAVKAGVGTSWAGDWFAAWAGGLR